MAYAGLLRSLAVALDCFGAKAEQLGIGGWKLTMKKLTGYSHCAG